MLYNYHVWWITITTWNWNWNAIIYFMKCGATTTWKVFQWGGWRSLDNTNIAKNKAQKMLKVHGVN